LENLNFYKIFDNGRIYKLISHELTHYFDSLKYWRMINPVSMRNIDPDDTSEKINKKLNQYYNFSDELNAFWNEASILFLRELKKDKDLWQRAMIRFSVFKDVFVKLLNQQFYNALSEQNKKRVLKRIYSFYNELKEELEKIENKKDNKDFIRKLKVGLI
jgi:hypothetical protein